MQDKPKRKNRSGATKDKWLEGVHRTAQAMISAERDELLERTRKLRDARLAREAQQLKNEVSSDPYNEPGRG